MADNGNKRNGVSGGYDQELYASEDAVYDTEIGVDDTDDGLDDRERAVAR